MASEIKSWEIIDGKLAPLESSLINDGKREKEHLEQWIKSNPKILGDDIVIIGEQVHTRSGPLDFLGIDNNGNTVIVELKRDRLPREALVQAIDYASDIATWEVDRFREICKSFTGNNLEDLLQEQFEDILIEELTINQSQRLLLVGTAVDESLGRMIGWLSDNYSVSINAVVLHYAKTRQGGSILSRMVIIPEEVEKQHSSKGKLPMSNQPGIYDRTTLERKLTEYLSNNLVSSQRIRDYLLPTLLEKGKVTRNELRKEFVRRQGADDESQAGYFLALISSQLGYQWNDHLRQVVHYEFPNHAWEKDNFEIKSEYRDLVEKVLRELATKPE
jgi:hypothetical protein